MSTYFHVCTSLVNPGESTTLITMVTNPDLVTTLVTSVVISVVFFPSSVCVFGFCGVNLCELVVCACACVCERVDARVYVRACDIFGTSLRVVALMP